MTHLFQVLTRMKTVLLIFDEGTNVEQASSALTLAREVDIVLGLNLETIYLFVEDNFPTVFLWKIQMDGRLFRALNLL